MKFIFNLLFNRLVLNLVLFIYCLIITVIIINYLKSYENIVKDIERNKFAKDFSKRVINRKGIKVMKNTRILCLVATQPKQHKTKALAVKQTWGKRCDILHFVSSEDDPSLPAIGTKCEIDDHPHLWCKIKQGFEYVINEYVGQFDWIYKADDDTFAIIENLRHLVSDYDPNHPIWFGCPFATNGIREQVYTSGGIV